MQTIAFLDRSSCEALPGQPKPQLRMVAWSAEQRQLTLQHTVQLPCTAGREPRRYVVVWARDSSQLAVHVPEDGGAPGCAWVITSQGEVTFCHGGIAFAHAWASYGLAPAARGSDSGMFAVQLTIAFLSKVQALPEAGSCHLFESTELADMAWAPATDSSSSLLILLSSDLLVIIDCAASPAARQSGTAQVSGGQRRLHGSQPEPRGCRAQVQRTEVHQPASSAHALRGQARAGC